MKMFHLTELCEAVPAVVTPLIYGRYLASVQEDGKVSFDNHVCSIDSEEPPSPGEKVMICCNHDYFCSRLTEYEANHRH